MKKRKFEDWEYSQIHKDAYGNDNLATASDGSNRPFIFVQCNIKRPTDEAEEICRDIAAFGVLVPFGEIGEIHGRYSVWMSNDHIAYKGCNTWSGGGTFSPDGSQIAYVSNQGGAWAVWVIPRAGGTASKVFDLPLALWGTGH